MDTTIYYKKVMPNGLTVALLPVKSKVVHCGFAIHSGSRNDPDGLEGLAHFVEHMIFKGTSHRKAWHILNRMEVVGGELNAYTTKEETFVYTIAPRKYLVRSMELLADLLFCSTFPANELQRERDVVADEINLYKDTPSELIFDDFEEQLFVNTRLGHPILGDNESLARITSEDMQTYARHNFVPGRMVFFCMGQVSPERFEALCDRHIMPFAPTAPGDERRVLHPIPIDKPFDIRWPKSTYQAHTLVGGVAPSLHDEYRTETSVITNILAGSAMNTRLNVLLREKKGWVYGVESSYAAISDTGWWQIYFGSDPSNAQRALDTVMRELHDFTEIGMTDNAFRAWVKQIKGQMEMATEQSENVFLDFGKQLLHYSNYRSMNDLHEKLDAMTPDLLRRISAQLFDANNINTLIYLGDSKNDKDD